MLSYLVSLTGTPVLPLLNLRHPRNIKPTTSPRETIVDLTCRQHTTAPNTSRKGTVYLYHYCISFYFVFSHFYFPASGQAVVTGVAPSPPRFLPSNFIPHRVQQSHCSSIFHGVLLPYAFALSESQFVHKKKSPRFYTSMHSGGFELTKLTYIRLEDNLIRHRGGRHYY